MQKKILCCFISLYKRDVSQDVITYPVLPSSLVSWRSRHMFVNIKMHKLFLEKNIDEITKKKNTSSGNLYDEKQTRN
jgi:hypothetical protein